jgi:hypothetical protein
VSTESKQQSALSITTLVIASCSSLVAAAVVSRVWGGGTLVGAAVTPVIVALVSEGLKKPATVIGTVRETRTSARRYDPVAEGRRGVREGDLAMASRTRPAPERERSIHRAGRGAPRRPLILAVVTGLVAFAIAAVLLTSSDLVLGRSVTGTGQRTTLFSGSSSNAKKDQADTTTTEKKTTPSSTTPTTPTTTTPTQTSTTPTTTTPTTPAPDQNLHSPDTQEPAPAQTQPPSSGTPAPSPTPAPSAQPPASTTPSSP